MFLTLLACQSVNAGTWTGGGGGGAACFTTIEEAKNAVDNEGRLKPDYYDKIMSLWPLDLEFMGNFKSIKSFSNESAREYISRVLDENYKKVAPNLVRDLKEALSQIELGWNSKEDKGPLPKFPDTGFSIALAESCKEVQIVIRYMNINADGTCQLDLNIDRKLLQKLIQWRSKEGGVFLEARLMLHEAVYVYLARQGHTTSTMVRPMVNYLLNQMVADQLKHDPAHTKWFLQAIDRFEKAAF